MAEMIAKIKITDAPAFDKFKAAAPAWLEQVTEPGYKATQAEKEMFGAIMAIVETND